MEISFRGDEREITNRFFDILQKFVRRMWDFRDHANEYFEEVIALLLDVFRINNPEELTQNQILALLQVIEKALDLNLIDEDVEQCLDILNENAIKTFPLTGQER